MCGFGAKIKTMKVGLRRQARHYILSRCASIAMMFGILAPVLVGAAGMTLDYAMAYLVQQRLASALDAAALAGAATSTDPVEIEQRIKEFFEVNYPDEEFGTTMEPKVNVTGDQIEVTVSAYHSTTFMKFLGVDQVDIDAATTVQRQVQGIEVVLVLDVTGSMGGSKIEALRRAAANFVYIMYGINLEDGAAANVADLDDMGTRNRNYIKIGLVPYSSSVNVGPYGLGEDLDGSYYGSAFVNNPHDLTYRATSNSDYWGGCVLAEDYPLDTLDHEGNWDMYRYCRRNSDDRFMCGDYAQSANTNCPRTPLTPLVTSPSVLRSSIDTLAAGGHTYGNYGMVWGWRVLSPEFPFEEATEWDNVYWRKAIIMMTDGVNTIHSRYSAYGFTGDDGLDGAGELDERFQEVCTNLKQKNVTLYTITFSSGSDGAKDAYENCATTPDYYYHAPDDEDLVNVFETISRQLSNLYISR